MTRVVGVRQGRGGCVAGKLITGGCVSAGGMWESMPAMQPPPAAAKPDQPAAFLVAE